MQQKGRYVAAQSIHLYDDLGNGYLFNIYPIGTHFNAVPAVYVWTRPVQAAWHVIYVGQTDDIERRLNTCRAQHNCLSCAERQGATHFMIHQESNERRRFEIEAGIRRRYDPPCNKQ